MAAGVLAPLSARASVVSELKVPENHEPRVSKENFYPFIELDGKPYDRGLKYGREASEAIKRNIDFYSGIFKKNSSIDWDKAQQLSQKFVPVIEKNYPEALEEMKGVADGSGRKLSEIVALNCRSEVLFANADACTCVLIPAERAQDGHVLLGQTWDWLNTARPNSVVLRLKQEGKPTILMVCEAGLIGGKGLNSEGLAVGLNATSVGKGQIGMPLHLMMRQILNSSLPTEAIKSVSSVRRAGSGTFNVVTRNNNVMMIEFSPMKFDVIMSRGEPLVHTNHYLSPLIAPDDTVKNFIPSTFTRLNTAEKRLAETKSPIGMSELMLLLSDHENYPESICYHEDPRIIGERYCSVYGMAADVTAGKLWVSIGNPCEGRISEYSL